MNDAPFSPEDAPASSTTPETKMGHNGVDFGKAQDFVSRIEACQAEIDAIMAKAKEDCQPHRDDIKEIKDEALNEGFKEKPFNAVVRKRKLESKIADVPKHMDEAQTHDYGQLCLALEGK